VEVPEGGALSAPVHERPSQGGAKAGLEINNGDVMRDAAIADLGIALFPTFAVGAAISAKSLRVIELGAKAEDEFDR